MKQLLYCLCLLLILSNFSFAQNRIITYELDTWCTKRVQRSISFNQTNNAPLKELFNGNSSAIHIIDVLINALIAKKITAYTKDSIALSTNQILQILSDTKEITGHDYTSSAINELMIYEDWYMNRKTDKMSMDFIRFAPVVRKSSETAIYFPLFWINAIDFFTAMKGYSIVQMNMSNPISLQQYFDERLFESKILNIKTINVESNKDATDIRNLQQHIDNIEKKSITKGIQDIN